MRLLIFLALCSFATLAQAGQGCIPSPAYHQGTATATCTLDQEQTTGGTDHFTYNGNAIGQSFTVSSSGTLCKFTLDFGTQPGTSEATYARCKVNDSDLSTGYTQSTNQVTPTSSVTGEWTFSGLSVSASDVVYCAINSSAAWANRTIIDTNSSSTSYADGALQDGSGWSLSIHSDNDDAVFGGYVQ